MLFTLEILQDSSCEVSTMVMHHVCMALQVTWQHVILSPGLQSLLHCTRPACLTSRASHKLYGNSIWWLKCVSDIFLFFTVQPMFFLPPSGLIPVQVIWRTWAPVVASSGFLSSLIRRKRGNLREMPFSGSTWGQTSRQNHSQYTAIDACERLSFVTCAALKRVSPRCVEYISQAIKSPLVGGFNTSKIEWFKNPFSSRRETALLSYSIYLPFKFSYYLQVWMHGTFSFSE